MSGYVPDGAPLRHGVPGLSPWIERTAEFEKRIERALASGAMALVTGPAGIGKSTAVAAWLAARPDRGAVWVASGSRVRGWEDVLDRFVTAVGFEPWRGELGPLVEHLRGLPPIVLVIDRADEFADPLDPRLVADDLGAIPALSVVLVARTPMRGFALLGPARLQVLPPAALAMSPDAADRLLRAHGFDVPAPVVGQITAAVEGSPAAVVDVATRWSEDRRRLLPADRRSVERLAALSALARAEAVLGPVARRLLLLVASLLEAPQPVVDEVAVQLLAATPALVRRLAAEGHIAERASVFSARPVWMVASNLRSELSVLADELVPDLVAEAHALAIAAPESRELEAFHRARSGAPEEAAQLVLRRWYGDPVPGGAALRAVLRSLPDDILGAEPVLAALRVALHGMERRPADSWALEDRILRLPPEVLDSLDIGDRVLVEAAAAEVLTRRGLLHAAIQRAAPWIDRVGHDLAAMTPRGRRAVSYLLVVVAEIHAAQLVPQRAMPLAVRVLALDSRDRWAITKYRASAVAAFCQMFSGDRDRMRASLVQADLYFALGDFESGPVRTFQWLTEFADATRVADLAGIDAARAAFAACGEDDAAARVTAEMIGAVRVLLARDPVGAEATLSRIVASAEFSAYPPAVRALALVLAAHAAVAGRRAGGALDILADAVAPPGHAVCFDAVRATAHLALGQPQAALDTTAGCLAMGPRHSVESLATVHVSRSVAHLELRHPDSARVELLRGIHLLPAAWRRSALAGLPAATLHGLAEILGDGDEHLEVRSLLRELSRQDQGMLSVAPTLSRKELKLLLLLQEGLALTEIADRLFVSINTVKSQCRSLYRKLGVSSRHEAVDLAFVRGTGPR